MSENVTPDHSLSTPEQGDRDERIAELEQRLSSPPRVGVQPLVALAALGVAIGLMWQYRLDFAYFFSPTDAVQLGAEGDYHFDRGISNRYVAIHGLPTSRGSYSPDGSVVALGIRDTPIMLWRPALPTEEWKKPAPPPRPDQRSFGVKGRLIARDEAPARYTDAFRQLDAYGEVAAKWLLVEGERPKSDPKTFAWLGALTALAVLNLWLLVRGLIALKRQSPKASSMA